MTEINTDLEPNIITLKQVMRREALIASIIPMVVILVAGAVGAQQVENTRIIWYILPILFCAVAAFIAERFLLQHMHLSIYAKFTEMAQTCQLYLEEDHSKRIPIEGEDDDFGELARAINDILDQHANLQETLDTQNGQLELEDHLQHMANQLSPVLSGDLRIRLPLTDERFGLIVEAVNSLIETLVQYTHWTLYSSKRVMDNASQISRHSLDLSKASQAYLQRLAKASKASEMLKSLAQRVKDTLQLALTLGQEADASLQQHIALTVEAQPQPALGIDTGTYQSLHPTTESQGSFSLHPSPRDYSIQPHSSPEKISQTLQKQIRLLEAAIYSTREAANMANAVLADLSFVSQQMPFLNTAILQTAEQSRTITLITEDWRSAAEALRIPEESVR